MENLRKQTPESHPDFYDLEQAGQQLQLLFARSAAHLRCAVAWSLPSPHSCNALLFASSCPDMAACKAKWTRAGAWQRCSTTTRA